MILVKAGFTLGGTDFWAWDVFSLQNRTQVCGLPGNPLLFFVFVVKIPKNPFGGIQMELLDEYVINSSTMAIVPAKEIGFDSVVIEEGRVLHVCQTPIQIIKHSCLRHWSTYEGRKEAVMHHTGFKRKVPIPIAFDEVLVAFPTHAINHIDCNWIMFHHVSDYIESDPGETDIHFRNGKSLKLKVSKHVIHSQVIRCLEITQRIKASGI